MSDADTTAPVRRRQRRGSRRVSRELALQSLYHWLLNRDHVDTLLAQATEQEEFNRADADYLRALVRGVVEKAAQLEAGLQPFLDRPLDQLSPIERALLLIAAYELTAAPDVPYRVAINEAVELAKSYGGTDGYKYVNGVLDKLAVRARPAETKRS
jgi:transcription antitermination protein NusB